MSWSVAEAKAKLSEVLARAKRSPQVIESRGEPVAVVLSLHEFDRLKAASAGPRKTGMQLWLEQVESMKRDGDMELQLPPRQSEPMRPDPFEDE